MACARPYSSFYARSCSQSCCSRWSCHQSVCIVGAERSIANLFMVPDPACDQECGWLTCVGSTIGQALSPASCYFTCYVVSQSQLLSVISSWGTAQLPAKRSGKRAIAYAKSKLASQSTSATGSSMLTQRIRPYHACTWRPTSSLERVWPAPVRNGWANI